MSRIAKATGVALGTGAVVLGGAGLAMAGSDAGGKAAGSPGVVSGNLVQVPVHVPINLCGNTVNVGGLLNPAFGNECVNEGGDGRNGGGNGNGNGNGGGNGGGNGNGGDHGYGS